MNKVAILLATYNGSKFILEQLQSIAFQTHENWHLYIRDDGSKDDTVNILKQYCLNRKNVTIIDDCGVSSGSAAGNFFHLLNAIDLNKFDYVCFSDQDDIWSPKKIEIAIRSLQETAFDIYSSNLVSFNNADKSAHFLDKSNEQKKYDYLFQGGSAGCTYLLSRDAATLTSQLTNNLNDFSGRSHDWLIYAICRSYGLKCFFDSASYIFYRQHESNVFGSMRGLSGFIKKFKMAKSAWYKDQILWLEPFLRGSEDERRIFQAIRRGKFQDRLFLASKVLSFRRRKSESLYLFFYFIFWM